MVFDDLELRLDNIKKLIRQSKIETINIIEKTLQVLPVFKPTDLIGDYIKDIETLL